MATKRSLDDSTPSVHTGDRPPASNSDHIAALYDIVTEHARAGLQEIAEDLHRRCGARVCAATIRRALRAQGIVRLKPVRRAYAATAAKGPKRYGYTAAHRRKDVSPYSTNLTDAEWDLVADLFEPAPGQRRTPVHYSRRELVNACSYGLRTSCAWRLLPETFPLWQAIYKAFARWVEAGVFEQIQDRLREQWRAPVQQNRIVLTKVYRKPRELSLAVIGRAGARHELGKIELPDSLNDAKSRLARVDPFGLKRVYDNLREKIEEGRISELLPMNPKDAPSGFYESLFGRIVEQVNGGSRKFGALAGRLAVDWMKAIPYLEMLGRWISRQRKSERKKAEQALNDGMTPAKPKTLDALIRDAFDLIEEIVRFQCLQLGKACRDLLLQALRQTGNADLVLKVFDSAGGVRNFVC